MGAVRFRGVAAQPFVGRAAALAQLAEAYRRAGGGAGGAVFVSGEPGIGKTRLVERLADDARSGGGCVNWATSREGGGAPAFWPWVQVIRACVTGPCACDLDGALGPRIADALRLVEEPAVATEPVGEQARFRLFDSMATLLTHSCAASPLVVVLDDLHWADPSSLHFLNFLVPELRSSRVLVVGTFRDLDVDAGTEGGRLLVDTARAAPVVPLAGLQREEVAELLVNTTGADASEDLVGRVYERSGGNPLFVAELGRLLATRGDDVGSMSVPQGIRSVLDRRLARLSQPCHEVLTLAAVVGEEFGLDVLRPIAPDPAAVLDLLDEAIRARLVAGTDERRVRFRFSHALVRDVLYEALSLGRQTELHDRAAGVLEEAGASHDDRAAELALHAFRAAPAGNTARAADACNAAGERAMSRLAYEQAVHHFHEGLEALDLGPSDPDRRTALLLGLGEALLSAGDLPDAREAFAAAAELARSRGRPEDLARAALGFGAGLGGFEVQLFDDTQLLLIEEALAALPVEDSELRARLLARQSVALSFRESVVRRRDVSELAVAMARRDGDRVVLAQALAAHCDAVAGPEHVEERLAMSGEAVELALAAKDPAAELLARRVRLVALLEVGDVTAAGIEAETFARTADVLAQPVYSWYVPLWRGYWALAEGRLADVLEHAAEAEAIGNRAHSTNAQMLVATQRYAAYWQLGESEAARKVMFESFDGIQEMGPQAQLLPAMVSVFTGDDDTWNRLDRLPLAEAVPRDSEWVEIFVTLGEAAIRTGDREVAAHVAEALAPYSDLFAVDGIAAAPWGQAALAVGSLSRFLDRPEEARPRLEAAVAAHRSRGMTLFLAHSLAELGRLTGDAGSLAEAEALYGALGLGHRVAALELQGAVDPVVSGVRAECAFRREGDVWALAFGGRRVQARDRKGLHDLATLLSSPGTEVAAVDLAGVRGGADASEGLHAPGDAGEVLDARARRAYEARIRELQEDLDEAHAANDLERASRAEDELDALVGQLSAAVGLGGRARKAGDPAERARTAVTWRIKSAIDHVKKVHAPLGRHLEKSVRTGTFCAYDPEEPIDWEL